MRITVCAIMLFVAACSSPEVAMPTPSPADAVARSDIRAAIAKNGWAEECSEFLAMTPEERGTAAGMLVAFNKVPDTEAAIRYLNISLEECRKAKT